jgi:hypothetical protein
MAQVCFHLRQLGAAQAAIQIGGSPAMYTPASHARSILDAIRFLSHCLSQALIGPLGQFAAQGFPTA